MKYIYITKGTESYLRNIIKDHPDEQIYFLKNYSDSLLLQETEKATVFKEAQTYRCLDKSGEIEGFGTAVFEYILVRDEEAPIFLEAYQKVKKNLKEVAGLQCIQLGRALTNTKFLVLSFWDSGAAYQEFTQLPAHKRIEKIMEENNSQFGFSHTDTFEFPKGSQH